ncbi:class I SAM-dependent methyltransferase [Sulfuritalea sp.]|uniref:class I SAM-dependent methyltransferase n=1 Tax=Sulfuritalea sp. TaxID=2480090 RepID=UPI00286E9A6F|nr:class I SAM-dependent methyltransferase [Sulfuritalea sp.]
MSENPSLWVKRFTPVIKMGGTVLDLACGRGRHSLLLAESGFRVEALDRDAAALAAIADRAPGIVTRLADLEGDAWPYRGRAFDGIVVTNYLHRPLLPEIFDALAEDGVLIYETFMLGNERFGKPSNPAFLLRPGELLDLVRDRLRVVAFEQGEVQAPRQAVMQRLCATKRSEFLLPA